ncbi:MAG TPA: beta-N-acetylhexosaminidase, partial [Ktedonobacteraceae bacterium]|nr:beta-N-acetylhexosaminidase [Ktedonobacteraceae bacterium]
MNIYTNGMSLEEQIGQVLMVGFWGITLSQDIIDLISRYHIGNIILFSRNIGDTRQVLELTRSLQSIAKKAGHRYPLLIAIDQENGIVQRLGEAATIFPGNMALGAIGSDEIAYEVARATGQELQALGINMNLAPVVDVNNNPANPVIGVRSFGEDPQMVARLGAAMVKGYHEAGVISCLKHFPGHGDTASDSHLALPTIPHALERLEALELVPFRRGIEAGADSVMIAHISFPALTQQDELPATLSPAIVKGLLRGQMGFDGVIISDCLEMQAISKTFGVQRGAVMALQAGIDLVLISHLYERQRGSFETIRAAVEMNELAPEVIQQAAERVLRLKANYLSWETLPDSSNLPALETSWQGAINLASTGSEEHLQLQKRAYERLPVLVRNEEGLLPLHLDADERIVVISPKRYSMSMVEDRYYSDDVLVDVIRQYHPNVSIMTVPPGEASQEALQGTRETDILIVATVNAHMDEGQAEVVRQLVLLGRHVIGIAVRNPYDLQAFPRLRT